MEYNFKARQWVNYECHGTNSVILERLAELQTANGDSCNYRIELVKTTPNP